MHAILTLSDKNPKHWIYISDYIVKNKCTT